ncbi:hypothetical protein ACT7CT_09115 [Bacillus sanguinis]
MYHFLTFVSTLTSLAVTWVQGTKNRKSTTLVNLRIQELKEIREEGGTLISLIKNFMNEKKMRMNADSGILNIDPIINQLDMQLNRISSKLYRHTSQNLELQVKISYNQLLVLNLNHTDQLIEIQINIEQALGEYSRIEYAEIEQSL